MKSVLHNGKTLKTFALFLLCALLYSSSFGQEFNIKTLKPVTRAVLNKQGESAVFSNFDLFSKLESKGNIDPAVISNYTNVSLKKDILRQIVSEKNQALELTLPFNNTMVKLLLLKVDVLAEGFVTYSSESGDQPVNYSPGVFYRGIIDGDNNSLVALSFFNDEVIGMASSESLGNITLNREEKSDRYLIYSDKDLLVHNPNICNTEEPENYQEEVEKHLNDIIERDDKCVKLYIECDYALFVNKGSVANVNNYISAVYNNVAALYSNENILTQISSTFVWTSQDPYSTTSSYSALNKFRTDRPTFVGDLAHLAALGGNNIGGIAWVNSLCSSFKYAYSNIQATYQNVPTYSWTVEVMTHEIGHNLGSPHTHSCTWPGGAIDNCYPVEGSCSAGPAPTGGGTIMSYCHLTSYGINFNNGFGTLPGNLIRSKVSAAACLGTCSTGGGTPCEAPQNLTASNITNNSALISWNNALTATAYQMEYKPSGGTWITLPPQPTTSKLLTNLVSGTTYQVHVKTICTNENSDYGTIISFTTGNACDIPQGLLAENITTNSARVKWTAVSGATSYSLRYKLTSNPNWNTFTINATSVDFSGLQESTSYDVSVRANCGSISSNFTSTVTFVTLGNSGGDDPYCASSGDDASNEWINYVNLNTISNESGSNGGYGDFLKKRTTLNANELYTLIVQAGMIVPYKEFWTVWIDYNQDGYFQEASEKILNFTTIDTEPIKLKFYVPNTALNGKTWMRIQMKRNGYATSCEEFEFGEVEDYGITIVNPNGLISESTNSVKEIKAYPNPFNQNVNVQFIASAFVDVNIAVYDLQGNKLINKDVFSVKGKNDIALEGGSDLTDGVYIVKIKGEQINETIRLVKFSSGN